MSKQRSFDFPDDPDARLEPFASPAPKNYKPQKYEAYPKGKLPAAGDAVTLIHRLGNTKRVKFSQVVGPRAYVCWPIANETLAVSLNTGRVLFPKALAEWHLEPNALEMARVVHKMLLLEQKIAIE